jgi:hypothetical protein
MNKAEMTKVLSFCAALDGQQVTEAKVLMWLQVLDGASYEEVQTAIVPAYTVSLNGIVTARGLLDVLHAKAQPGRPVMYMEGEADLDESGWRSDPQPVCEEHGLTILRCDDCCKLLHYQAGWMDADARHSWAVANLYQAKELW